ncbi:unnamed protein product [Ectocarpus sp. 8 AP-2014]
MNECLLEIKTRGVISAATAAAVAGGGPSRTATTDAGEAGVTDDRGAPHPPPPVPDTLEAVSGALEGRGSAVPDQVAAVAGVNIIIPAVIPAVAVGPVISRETADGSAAAKEEEGGGRRRRTFSSCSIGGASHRRPEVDGIPTPPGRFRARIESCFWRIAVPRRSQRRWKPCGAGRKHRIGCPVASVCRSCYRGICGGDAGVC